MKHWHYRNQGHSSETILEPKKEATFFWSNGTEFKPLGYANSEGEIQINGTPEEFEAKIEEMRNKGNFTGVCNACLFLEIAKLRRVIAEAGIKS